MTKRVRIKFTNGLIFRSGVREILNVVASEYEFIESERPDFVIFGPYGSDIPKGAFTRIGYFCENMKPDLSVCDWAFGIPYEDEIRDDRYRRIQWHGFEPRTLVKQNTDTAKIIESKTRFCNFLYSNPVPYREEFFRELSKYKPVDAPGRSMNNMPAIDRNGFEDQWSRKRVFQSQYKFTIAFENYSRRGYNTEKLLDPMVANSLPIYLGNPNIAEHFNPKSFVNAHEYLDENGGAIARELDRHCRATLRDFRSPEFNSLAGKARRRLKTYGRQFKMDLQYRDFQRLIEKIIEIDRNDDLYAGYLSEPWFHGNKPPSNESVAQRWRQIFG